MKIVQVRRISQSFFFILFLWFCIASTVGEKFYQIKGWPVNWFLQLDPLVAMGTILTAHTLEVGLLWAVATICLTIIFGRFFCGWVCPFGSLHQFAGYCANRKTKITKSIELNKYRKAQSIKYYILAILLIMAAFPSLAATLQTGLLDPIPLVTRSFNLVLLPIIDRGVNLSSVINRFYDGAFLVFTVFFAAILLNVVIPRFYCRFVCPLGALFGLIDRFAIWRIGKRESSCVICKLCERSCEGGCEPAGEFHISECILCFNCLDDCRHNLIGYQMLPSLAGEITDPDISRRGFIMSLTGGVLAAPAIRLSSKIGSNWYYKIIRPPGAMEEKEFLKRCIKCGQCMRICPTNVIQPGGIEGGLENLWTPVLNNRIGSSGCQLNCVACGQICPTSAIRPITLAEKRGTGEFAGNGPIKLGTAFVDRGRCLPWAMNKPCIVCQENCPVSPKAIYTEDVFSTIRDGIYTLEKVEDNTLTVKNGGFTPGELAAGDFYVSFGNEQRKKITANDEKTIKIENSEKFSETLNKNGRIQIEVRLQRPWIDINKCIGCGICEHECPVSGLRAVRVSAEGETRSNNRKLSL